MEAPHDYDTSWSSSTNWSIASGSLLNSVTFESLFVPTTDSDQHEQAVDDLNAVDSTPKSPLILCPTSPGSGPCEIIISFAQKHELRQVYVRSTARVYEIYYASKPQSSNEYLCTVRCGIASRDEEVLHAANLDEAALARLKGADKELDQKRLKNDINSNSSEDDWVDVKVPDARVPDSGSSVASNFSVNLGSTQDLYEATAEITDANPCMSITLRLLSLQNKGCICVDELYVFADPVESADSENEVGQMGNAGGSSLMAMLAPTFLQLSKTAGLRCRQNEDTFGTKEKEKTQENGSKAIEPLNFANEILQEGKPSLGNQQKGDVQEATAATIEPNRHEMPPLKDREVKADISCGHIERLLNQLVSRVSRVEDLLFKFEENMLKPISSIDERLQRVEQQLEELTKKPKNSELPSCTRYSAPEFSCYDSDDCTPYNIGNYSSSHDLYASREKDFSLSVPSDEPIYSVKATQSFPSLVVTAPEFSNDDDVEDHASRTDSSKDKQKQTISIDDALASALAGFLSSTSIEPQKYTQVLSVKAPDFLHEEDGSTDKKVTPKSDFGVISEPSNPDTSDGMDSTTASVSSISSCPLDRIGEAPYSLNDNDPQQTGKEVVEDCQEQGTCHGTVDCMFTPAIHGLHQIAGDMGNREVRGGTREVLVLDEADIQNSLVEYHVDNFIQNSLVESHFDDVSDTDEEELPGNMKIKDEITKQGSYEEYLQNVLEFSYASSVVDFETAILDVKFTSQDNSNDKSPLEALLSDMLVTDTGASCSKRSHDGSQAGEECFLISVEDVEPSLLATDGHFSVDLDPLNLEVEKEDVEPSFLATYRHFSVDLDPLNLEVEKEDVDPAWPATDGHFAVDLDPLNLEVENLEDYHASSNQEGSAASLI